MPIFEIHKHATRRTNTREHNQKHSHRQKFSLRLYTTRGGEGAGVCCIFIYPLHSVGARLVESNRIELTDNVVLSGATQTTQWARSGLEKSSRVPTMKNSNVLLRPNNFPPPNRECVCSESAREEVQKRAVHRERESENVSCNWNMLPESEKPTVRKGLTLSNFSLSSLWLRDDERERARARWSSLHHLFGHPAVIRSWVSCQPQMKLPDFLDFVYTCRASPAPFSFVLLHTPLLLCRCLGAPYLCNILYFHEFPPPTQPHISVCLSGFFLF